MNSACKNTTHAETTLETIFKQFQDINQHRQLLPGKGKDRLPGFLYHKNTKLNKGNVQDFLELPTSDGYTLAIAFNHSVVDGKFLFCLDFDTEKDKQTGDIIKTGVQYYKEFINLYPEFQDTLTEYSVSGRGVHVYLRAPARFKKRLQANRTKANSNKHNADFLTSGYAVSKGDFFDASVPVKVLKPAEVETLIKVFGKEERAKKVEQKKKAQKQVSVFQERKGTFSKTEMQSLLPAKLIEVLKQGRDIDSFLKESTGIQDTSESGIHWNALNICITRYRFSKQDCLNLYHWFVETDKDETYWQHTVENLFKDFVPKEKPVFNQVLASVDWFIERNLVNEFLVLLELAFRFNDDNFVTASNRNIADFVAMDRETVNAALHSLNALGLIQYFTNGPLKAFSYSLNVIQIRTITRILTKEPYLMINVSLRRSDDRFLKSNTGKKAFLTLLSMLLNDDFTVSRERNKRAYQKHLEKEGLLEKREGKFILKPLEGFQNTIQTRLREQHKVERMEFQAQKAAFMADDNITPLGIFKQVKKYNADELAREIEQLRLKKKMAAWTNTIKQLTKDSEPEEPEEVDDFLAFASEVHQHEELERLGTVRLIV